MSAAVKKIKQVCKCENCGNEAEMVVTCILQETEAAHNKPAPAQPDHPEPSRVKGTGTCSSCGNEADMWVDL